MVAEYRFVQFGDQLHVYLNLVKEQSTNTPHSTDITLNVTKVAIHRFSTLSVNILPVSRARIHLHISEFKAYPTKSTLSSRY